MFVDYEFYSDVFNGTALTEVEFNKFGGLACTYITMNTLSRITDTGIFNYPEEVRIMAKNCACALAEYLKQVDDVSKSITGSSGGTSEGIIKSKTAGEVSVSYDTSLTSQYFLDPKKQEDQKQSILKLYLSPVFIGTRYYNLLSKVLDDKICPECSIF